MHLKILEFIKNKIVPLLFVLTPLISAFLFCLKDGHCISDIYIPLGGWSDELHYYKQIEGILSHGMPQGYFGYNQSRAVYGTFSVWGLIPLIPYVCFGLIAGWHYCSPIYANISFCIVAMLSIYILLRPKNKWMLMFSLFWIANPFLNRYVLSGVVEASILSQLTTTFACGIYLLSDNFRLNQNRIFTIKKDNIVLGICTFLICILTLERPYFAVLFLIPFWKAFKEKQIILICILPLLTIAIMGLFFFNSLYFCSTYFVNELSTDGLMDNGVVGLIFSLFSSVLEITKLIWYSVRYPDSTVGWYYMLLGIELIVMLTTCIVRMLSHKKVLVMYIVALLGEFLILLSIIILYDLNVGARHSLALIVANLIIIMYETNFQWATIFSCICVFSLFRIGNSEPIPYAEADYLFYMESLEQYFSELVILDTTISYNNVVAMPTSDTSISDPNRIVSTYYGLLFAMPSGVGISLDFENYYELDKNIKAGYILVHPEGHIRRQLEDNEMKCIFENQEFALYAKSF